MSSEKEKACVALSIVASTLIVYTERNEIPDSARRIPGLKPWAVEVVMGTNEWANGGGDAKEMTWKNPRTNEWVNETVNRWSKEPMWNNKQLSSDAMNLPTSEPMNPWIHESVNQVTQRSSEYINKWDSNDSVNQWEAMPCESMKRWFS